MQNKVSDKKRDLLEKLSSMNEKIYKAMLLKEQFLTIYYAENRKMAFADLREWIVAAIKSRIPSFVVLGYEFFRKRHYVSNYFVCRITSSISISEGITRIMQTLLKNLFLQIIMLHFESILHTFVHCPHHVLCGKLPFNKL